MAAPYVDYLGRSVRIPEPAILKPVPLWTGKQLFPLLLKPNVADAIQVNSQYKVCRTVYSWALLCFMSYKVPSGSTFILNRRVDLGMGNTWCINGMCWLQEKNYDDTAISHHEGRPVMCPNEGRVVLQNGCVHALIRGGGCTVSGHCDSSAREKVWRCLKRGAGDVSPTGVTRVRTRHP